MTVPNYFNIEQFREQGYALIDRLANHAGQSMGQGQELADQVLKFRDSEELLEEWKQNPAQSFEELIERVLDQSIRLTHPNYVGHQISPTEFHSALAGLVTDFLNNGMGVYEMGMAGTTLERLVVEMTAKQLCMDEQAGGVLTSGGSLGNLTALLAARIKSQPDVNINGQRQPMAVMVSEQAHYCVQRAATVMGWGQEGVILVPTDENLSMDVNLLPELLNKATQSGRQVIAVVGSACTTASGSYDDLRGISQFCQANDLWFNVDGAHGAAAAFSPKYRHLVDGIELADSVVLDFHKLLLTPALATTLIFRDGRNSFTTFQQKADYLFDPDSQQQPWHNLALRTFECTKFMIGLKIYSILTVHGTDAWEQNVTTLFDLSRQFFGLIEEQPSLQALAEPQSNIVCYRYFDPQLSEEALNTINSKIRESILHSGKFYIVKTTVHDTVWLRSTIGSATTESANLKELTQRVVQLGDQLR